MYVHIALFSFSADKHIPLLMHFPPLHSLPHLPFPAFSVAPTPEFMRLIYALKGQNCAIVRTLFFSLRHRRDAGLCHAFLVDLYEYGSERQR